MGERFMGPEKFLQSGQEILPKIEKEGHQELIADFLLIQHVDSGQKKEDKNRGISPDLGLVQIKELSQKFAIELLAEIDPKIYERLAGIEDSTVIKKIISESVVKTKLNDEIDIPIYYSVRPRTTESAKATLAELEEMGFKPHLAKTGIKKLNPIRSLEDNRAAIDEKMKANGTNLMSYFLTEDLSELKKMNMENPQEAANRLALAVDTVDAYLQRSGHSNYPRIIHGIAFTHNVPISAFLHEIKNLSVEESSKVKNGQGLKISFSQAKKPEIKFWGKDMENQRMD